MALANNLRKIVDMPTWEWTRFFPAANSALSEMCSVETPDNRYMYILVSTAFWRYDTYTDTWQQLASLIATPLLILSLKYLPYGGYMGQVVSATASTLTGAFLQGNTFIGNKIRIYAGTGAGQERTITGVTDAVIADGGIPTTATASVITDTTKKWDINQWCGYQVKIVDFAGQSQYRKILYNTATALTVSDSQLQPHAPQENQPFATAPTTASIYTIESNTVTFSGGNWGVTPDGTSRYRVLSGLIGCLTTAAAAPFQSYYVYDIASDFWVTRSTQATVLAQAGAVANDISFHRLDEGETGVLVSGTATVAGSGARALGDSAKSWTVDQYTNCMVRIIAGAGAGDVRRILGNTASILYIDGAFSSTPDTSSTYEIIPFSDMHFASGWAMASMIGYHSGSDMWCQGFVSDYGVASVLSVRIAGLPSVACTGARATNGIKTITAAPNNGGANYVVGDVLTCTGGSGTGLLIVTSTDSAGVVTGLKLQKSGNGYAAGTGKGTSGGSGNGACTYEIVAVDTIGTITTAIAHNFQKGDSIIFGGDALWNGTYTIIGVSSTTSFDIVITAAGAASAATAQSSSVIVDAGKNWTPNEHAGKIVQLSLTGLTGTSSSRKILSNTSTALTLYGSVLGAAAVEGTGRYIIYDLDAFGRAVQYKNPTLGNTGTCTASVSATVLTDTNKAWRGNQWLGYTVKVISGAGYNFPESVITSNTATTLVVSGGYGFTPDTTSKYIIRDTFGVPTTVTNTTNAVITDTTKAWTANMWSGFKVRINGGEGMSLEMPITSNTATALTITGVFTTAPVANSSVYTIIGAPVRGVGHELTWLSGTTINKGRYIISPRGGTTSFIDRYDIQTNTWDLTFACKPDTETFPLGTMYAYDGKDRIYIQLGITGRILYLDLSTYRIEGAGQMPYVLGSTGIGAAVNGNRMEVIQTADGLKFLYVMKHTGAALSAGGGGTEMFRTLLFW